MNRDLIAVVECLPYIKSIFPHAAWTFDKSPNSNGAMASVEFIVHRQVVRKNGSMSFTAWQGQVQVDDGKANAIVHKHVPDTGWVMATFHQIKLTNGTHIIPWLSKARETIGLDSIYDLDSLSGLPGYFHMPNAYRWLRVHLDRVVQGTPTPTDHRLYFEKHLNSFKVRLRNYPDPVYVQLVQGGIIPEHRTCLGRLTDANGNTPKQASRLRDAVEDYFAELFHRAV